MSNEKHEIEEEPKYILFSEFLETTPPNQTIHIEDISTGDGNYEVSYLSRPEIRLYCENEHCKGVRFFRCTSEKEHLHTGGELFFIKYICSNCQKNQNLVNFQYMVLLFLLD
jgi:hypothetical protein